MEGAHTNGDACKRQKFVIDLQLKGVGGNKTAVHGRTSFEAGEIRACPLSKRKVLRRLACSP